MKKKLILYLWFKLTALTYRQGYGWPWMQSQVEEIASSENYKVELKRH